MKGLPDDRRSASGPASAAGTNCPSSRALAVVVPHSPYRIGADDPVGSNGGPVFVESDREWLRQHLLRCGGAGRLPELESVVLRFPRYLEFHHCRQTARFIVGHGSVRTNLRIFECQPSCSAGVDGRRIGCARVCGRQTSGDAGCGSGGGSCVGSYARCRPDVQVRQSRCIACSAHDSRRLLRDSRHVHGGGSTSRNVGGARRSRAGLRFSHQDVARADGVACIWCRVFDCRTGALADSPVPPGDRCCVRCHIGWVVGVGSVAVAR